MITTHTDELAEELANNFKYIKDRALRPVPGTPMYALTESLVNVSSANNFPSAQATKVNTAEGSYTAILNRVVGDQTKILSNVIRVIKNDIAPLVVEIQGELPVDDESLATLGYRHGIKVINIHASLTNEIFTDILSVHGTAAEPTEADHRVLLEALGLLGEGDEKAFLTTRNVAFDNSILAYVGGEIAYLTDAIRTANTDRTDLKMLAASVLALNTFIEGDLTPLEGFNEDNAKRLSLIRIRGKLVRECRHRLAVLSRDISGGRVLCRNTSGFMGHDGPRVYGKNYTKWLQNGGTPEAVLSAFKEMQQRPGLDLDVQLRANHEQFISKYKTDLRLLRLTAKVGALARNKGVVGNYLSKVIKDGPMETDGKIEAQERLAVALKSHCGEGDRAFAIFIRNCVVAAICPSPTVKLLLDNIDGSLLESGNDDMVDAIMLGVCNLVASWVVSQTL